jgi:hypothetical protein
VKVGRGAPLGNVVGSVLGKAEALGDGDGEAGGG